MAITGIAPGATGTFVATLQPSGSTFPPGTPPPTWTQDGGSNVSLVVAPDGMSCTCAVIAAPSITSFNLRIQANPISGTLVSSVGVPINFPPLTGIQINQVS